LARVFHFFPFQKAIKPNENLSHRDRHQKRRQRRKRKRKMAQKAVSFSSLSFFAFTSKINVFSGGELRDEREIAKIYWLCGEKKKEAISSFGVKQAKQKLWRRNA
jgi:hypothetical protein